MKVIKKDYYCIGSDYDYMTAVAVRHGCTLIPLYDESEKALVEEIKHREDWNGINDESRLYINLYACLFTDTFIEW